MSATMTHSRSVANDFSQEFASEWAWLVKQQANKWNEFFKYWFDLSTQKKIPLHIMRFEDTVSK